MRLKCYPIEIWEGLAKEIAFKHSYTSSYSSSLSLLFGTMRSQMQRKKKKEDRYFQEEEMKCFYLSICPFSLPFIDILFHLKIEHQFG